MNYFIIILSIILIISLFDINTNIIKRKEDFISKNIYPRKLFTPINIRNIDLKPFKFFNSKNYIDTEFIVEDKTINTLLSKIHTIPSKYSYKEYNGSIYDYDKGYVAHHFSLPFIYSMINKLFSIIKTSFNINAPIIQPKLCNSQ